jgi:hypothetical protein
MSAKHNVNDIESLARDGLKRLPDVEPCHTHRGRSDAVLQFAVLTVREVLRDALATEGVSVPAKEVPVHQQPREVSTSGDQPVEGGPGDLGKTGPNASVDVVMAASLFIGFRPTEGEEHEVLTLQRSDARFLQFGPERG